MDNLGPFKDWRKPSWDAFCMNIAFAAAMRSPDPATKHGCYIVDQYYRPLSLGYNGFPPGSNDGEFPLTRPEKYAYFVHSEENAIANKQGVIDGAIVYVTGHPCSKCFRLLRANRVSKIIYGPIGSNCVDQSELEIIQKMNKKSMSNFPNIILEEYKEDVTEIMKKTVEYVNIKINS